MCLFSENIPKKNLFKERNSFPVCLKFSATWPLSSNNDNTLSYKLELFIFMCKQGEAYKYSIFVMTDFI